MTHNFINGNMGGSMSFLPKQQEPSCTFSLKKYGNEEAKKKIRNETSKKTIILFCMYNYTYKIVLLYKNLSNICPFFSTYRT